MRRMRSAGNMHANGMAAFADDWETKIAFMRVRHLSHATWSETGALISAVAAPLTPETDDDQTQRSLDPEELERRSRAERRRIAQASSGGPVPRLVPR